VTLYFSNPEDDFGVALSTNLIDNERHRDVLVYGAADLSRQRVSDRDDDGGHCQILDATRDAAAVVGMQVH
jgi:hypothetical protein